LLKSLDGHQKPTINLALGDCESKEKICSYIHDALYKLNNTEVFTTLPKVPLKRRAAKPKFRGAKGINQAESSPERKTLLLQKKEKKCS
jgi:hypothetical protein